MLRDVGCNWTRSAVMLAMLMISACASNQDDQPTNETAVASAPTLPPTDTGVNASELGSEVEFRQSVGNTIRFATGSHDLDGAAQSTLQKQAAWLLQYPHWKVVLEGHADERGTREYNLGLGERRAQSVTNYLVALGLDGARISVISYGKERPICSEATEGCWAENRRAVSMLSQ
jgi:peptidoglycan-associated lipoprotein